MTEQASNEGRGVDRPRSDENEKERIDRELQELLQELRVAIPGVQVLFAFLLTIPFAQGFTRIGDGERYTYSASLLTAAAATALLISPTSYHRLHFRSGEKKRLLFSLEPARHRRLVSARRSDRARPLRDHKLSFQSGVRMGRGSACRGMVWLVLVRAPAGAQAQVGGASKPGRGRFSFRTSGTRRAKEVIRCAA